MRRFAVIALLALALLPAGAHAQKQTAVKEFVVGPIKITQPWTRVTPDASTVAGGFMRITNTGTVPDTLIAGTALISHRFEVHEMVMDQGVMKMRELRPGLVIRPGETVELRPGSFHVMFIGLKQRIKLGHPFKGTLVFEKAGTTEIEYSIEPFGTRVPGDGGQPMPRTSETGQHQKKSH
ncbi:MAG: copper chaperone PCu(A)C [Hyphomicrobiaceae bacterium]|nr:MAG: copper chaperone PCu(A)C [Hyphomicrobiaceae bacterium]